MSNPGRFRWKQLKYDWRLQLYRNVWSAAKKQSRQQIIATWPTLSQAGHPAEYSRLLLPPVTFKDMSAAHERIVGLLTKCQYCEPGKRCGGLPGFSRDTPEKRWTPKTDADVRLMAQMLVWALEHIGRARTMHGKLTRHQVKCRKAAIRVRSRFGAVTATQQASEEYDHVIAKKVSRSRARATRKTFVDEITAIVRQRDHLPEGTKVVVPRRNPIKT